MNDQDLFGSPKDSTKSQPFIELPAPAKRSLNIKRIPLLFVIAVVFTTLITGIIYIIGLKTDYGFFKYIPSVLSKVSPKKTPESIKKDNDLRADIVLGQPDFAQAIPGEIVSFKVAGPGGVTVDRSVRPNRVYIFDGMNSRILGYSSLGICSDDDNKACSSDSDCGKATCSIQVGGEEGRKKADLVFGQPSFNTSACNGDGTWINFPKRAKASNNSMCSLPENTYSPYEYGSYSSMVTDSDGNLYTADPFNNRVLKYNSPFTTDTIADEVWGQDNFSDTGANRGLNRPNAKTLSLINSSTWQTLTVGLDLDLAGNLWVTDPGNNRVLRFPKNTDGTISKSADIVLGQLDFSSFRSGGTSLSTMSNPSAVGVHPDGRVFVADTENSRILVFTPPFTNGQTATFFGSGYRHPNGINFETNPSETTIPVGIWIQDSRNSQLVMFDDNARAVKVLHKSSYNNDGNCNYICEARGSIGITSDGDIISANSSNGQNAYYFKHPIPLAGTNAYTAYKTFFTPPFGHNYLSDKGFSSARGLALANNQLIVSDQKRILYWNTPNGIDDLLNFKPADGVAGVSNFKSFADIDFGRIDSDKDNNLWVAHGETLEHYSLPLSSGQMPDAVIKTKDFQFLGVGNSIEISFEITDISADPQGKFLWMALAGKDRVIRVRIPTNFSDAYIIDVIIGGTEILQKSHAWGDVCSETVVDYPRALCFPGSVSLDKLGNVFVSDTSLEFFGDHYLFRYDSSKFPQDNTSLLVYFTGDASQKFSNVSNWQAAFNSENKLVLGFAYSAGSEYQSHIGYVNDIYNLTTSKISIPDKNLFHERYGQPYAIKFDDNDNLYVADLNWGRVLVYSKPLQAKIIPPPPPPAVKKIISKFILVGRKDKQFTEKEIATLADSYSLIILTKFHAGGNIDLQREDVRKLKNKNSNLNVLAYFSANRRYLADSFRNDTFKNDWYLKDKKTGNPLTDKDGNHYVDLSNVEYRKWAEDVIFNWMKKAPYSGVAFGNASYLANEEPWKSSIGKDKIDQWNQGLRDLLRETKSRLASKLVIFNGEDNKKNLDLLNYTDGVINGRFCVNRRNTLFFSPDAIKNDLSIMKTNNDKGKMILYKSIYFPLNEAVFPPTKKEKENIGRYCLGNILLLSNSNLNYFKSGPGNDVELGEIDENASEFKLKLGFPMGDSHKINLIDSREFTLGWVFVNTTSTPQTLVVPQNLVLANGGVRGKTFVKGEKYIIPPTDAVYFLKP